MTDRERAEQAEAPLAIAVNALNMCIDNDKTEYDYRYAGPKMAKNRVGCWPPSGERWKTPREAATDALASLPALAKAHPDKCSCGNPVHSDCGDKCQECVI